MMASLTEPFAIIGTAATLQTIVVEEVTMAGTTVGVGIPANMNLHLSIPPLSTKFSPRSVVIHPPLAVSIEGDKLVRMLEIMAMLAEDRHPVVLDSAVAH